MRFFLTAALVLVLMGCTMPKVIVLNDPLDARQHNDLGVAYQHKGEFDLALREYGRAAKLDRQWGLPLVNRGNVHAAQGEWSEAADDYRRALQRDPANAGAMNNLGWALLQAGRPDQALPWGQKAVAADPAEPTYLDTLAEIHLALGEATAARRLVMQALDLSPAAELRFSLEAKKSRLQALP